MSDEEMIAVIKGRSAGKIIEYQSLDHSIDSPFWSPMAGRLQFNFARYCYRIKPEPIVREWLIPENILRMHSLNVPGNIHVREVLPE